MVLSTCAVRHTIQLPTEPPNAMSKRLRPPLLQAREAVCPGTPLCRGSLAATATPHAMTGKTPAALFLHRELRTRLDLLHPVLPTEVSQPATASRVADQQRKISERSANSALQKSLEVGNSVHARVYNKPVKWLPGTVVRAVGAKSFEVKLASGVLVCRHLNQL